MKRYLLRWQRTTKKTKDSKKRNMSWSENIISYITNPIAKSRNIFEKFNNTVDGMLVTLSSKLLNAVKQINIKLLL